MNPWLHFRHRRYAQLNHLFLHIIIICIIPTIRMRKEKFPFAISDTMTLIISIIRLPLHFGFQPFRKTIRAISFFALRTIPSFTFRHVPFKEIKYFIQNALVFPAYKLIDDLYSFRHTFDNPSHSVQFPKLSMLFPLCSDLSFEQTFSLLDKSHTE